MRTKVAAFEIKGPSVKAKEGIPKNLDVMRVFAIDLNKDGKKNTVAITAGTDGRFHIQVGFGGRWTEDRKRVV